MSRNNLFKYKSLVHTGDLEMSNKLYESYNSGNTVLLKK